MKKIFGLVLLLTTFITTYATSNLEVWVRPSPLSPTVIKAGKNRPVFAFRVETGIISFKLWDAELTLGLKEKFGNQLSLPGSFQNLRATIDGIGYPVLAAQNNPKEAQVAVGFFNDVPDMGPYSTNDVVLYADVDDSWSNGDTVTGKVVRVSGSPPTFKGERPELLWVEPKPVVASTAVIQRYEATITSIVVKPSPTEVGTLVLLEADGFPGAPFIYGVQASTDMVRWFDMAGTSASPEGKIRIGVTVTEKNIVLGPLLRGNKFFFRLQTISPFLP